MYYLEDCLDELQHLPEEIRKNLMKLEQMDYGVLSSMNNIRKKVDILFSKAEGMNPDDLEKNFKAIMSEGQKSVEQSEEKIQLAKKMKNLMTKYIDRIDKEIYNFKVDLETDYIGTTEHIEKRSLDSEQSSITYPPPKKFQLNRHLFGEKKKEIYNINQQKQTISSTINVAGSSQYYPNPIQPLMTLPKSLEIKASSSAIPGTSQTISTTQQYFRKPSPSDSDVSIDMVSPEMSFRSAVGTEVLFSELCGDEILKNESQKQKKTENVLLTDGDSSETEPDDSRYCICNDVAHGVMVACDNKMCPHEWFHCDCVGIKTPPKGKWYCPKCKKTPTKNRKTRKSTHIQSLI